MHMDCCAEKAAAKNGGCFEGMVGDSWYTHDCQGWPEPKPKRRSVLFLERLIRILQRFKEYLDR